MTNSAIATDSTAAPARIDAAAAPFAHLSELASSGGRILFATDDFFQIAEHLIRKDDPVFDPKAFTEF
ncbi:hypothetical protein HK405_013049, partial [Cladochytrium tenue]